MALSLRVLGPLTAEIDGDAIGLGGSKQRTVLGLLLIEAGRVVSTERLVETVWGDDAAPTAPSTLQVYVSSLRRALGPARPGEVVIATQRPGYVARVGRDELDLLAFEADCAAARRALQAGRLAEARQLFASALARWRGPALADLADQPWAAAAATRHETVRLTALGDSVDLALVVGDDRAVVPGLEALCTDHPLDERFTAQLMLALYRSGRQADALGAYRRTRQHLVDELGLDPGPALRDLEARILRQDPALGDTGAPGGDFARAGAADRDATVLHSSAKVRSARLHGAGGPWPLDRAVTTIGRRADRDVTVLDSDASRLHAEVRRLADGHIIVDVGSGNGTSVNGRRIIEHALADGDEIEIGKTRLTYRLE